MAKKRHTPEEILEKLRQADHELAAGRGIADVCERLAISEATFHRWRNQYGGLKGEDRQRLRALEAENAQLRKQVTDQAMEIAILREALHGNF